MHSVVVVPGPTIIAQIVADSVTTQINVTPGTTLELTLPGAAGPTGPPGLQGIQGATGAGTQGVQGFNGAQGLQGATGAGTQGFTGAGTQGVQGFDGTQGVQGFTGAGTQGVQGFNGAQGLQGATGAGTQGVQGSIGLGLISGGTTGQLLAKASNNNYDTEWSTLLGTPSKIAVAYSSGTTTIDDILGLTTGEPTGFENLDAVLSFDNSTRTFTITGSHVVWLHGVKHAKVTSSIVIPSTAGLYYIYYDLSATLQYGTTFFNLSQVAPVAYVYWNGTSCIYLGEERHGIVLDWRTHEYLHRTVGAAYASGFFAGNYVTNGAGNLDSHAQLDLDGGTFYDEDIRVVITHSNTPTGYFEQDLQGPAKIPVLYRSGTVWTIDAATNFPVKYGTTRITYNLDSAGNWSTPEIASNSYAAYWVIATNNILYPVVAIMGQSTDSNLEKVKEDSTWASLNLDGFPSLEFRPLYRVIFQTGSYGNAVNARIRDILDFRAGEVRQVSAGFAGVQGIQGLQGTQGLQGIQGIGTQGTQGLQGTGTQGVQGFDGTQGTQGLQGTQGFEGIQGFTGTGTQGIQGFEGIQGFTGTGTQGVQGFDGTQGFTGTGTQGVQGFDGTQGIQGLQGTGTQGTQGLQGTQGFEGIQGFTGTGTQGIQGFEGTQGFTGTGTQGVQGFDGTQGFTGTGTQGVQGFDGTQGFTGTGTQGVQGFEGIQGITGIGTQGTQGIQGTLANFQETFETVSKNLKNNPSTLTYTNDILTSITYTGINITKTLNYTSGILTSIVLSGNTPSGISLSKTLTYTGSKLTSISYS